MLFLRNKNEELIYGDLGMPAVYLKVIVHGICFCSVLHSYCLVCYVFCSYVFLNKKFNPL